MTSVLSSVTHWLGGTREVSPERTPVSGDNGSQGADDPASTAHAPEPPSPDAPAGGGAGAEEGGAVGEGERSAVDLQEVSEKAMQTAKEWGSMWGL